MVTKAGWWIAFKSKSRFETMQLANCKGCSWGYRSHGASDLRFKLFNCYSVRKWLTKSLCNTSFIWKCFIIFIISLFTSIAEARIVRVLLLSPKYIWSTYYNGKDCYQKVLLFSYWNKKNIFQVIIITSFI